MIRLTPELIDPKARRRADEVVGLLAHTAHWSWWAH